MRVFRVLLPVLFVAGCSAVPSAEDMVSSSESLSSDGKDSVSVAWGPCAYSRAAILASVSPARAEAISRGFEWLDADVPFNMSATYEGYRTDCSGFVSMCWALGMPGQNTRTLGTSGSGSYKLDSYDDLVPADALVRAGKHSVIFLGWNDSARKGACVLEQSSTKNDMQFRVRMTATLKSEGFVPVRADKFANDIYYSTPNASLADSTPSKPPASGDNETKKTEDDVAVCTSKAVSVVCAEAVAAGIECGRVIDNCGRAVDCTGLSGFGCATGETCSANKCTSTCTPKKKEDLCYSARLERGAECGKVADGCGGTVDCDDIPGFGCAGGDTCSANKCRANLPDDSSPSSEDRTGDLLEGDPGDDEDDDARTSSTRTPDDDEDDYFSSRRNKNVSSSGCSSAPGSTSGFGGPLAGLLLLLGARRRRSTKG